MTTPKSSPTLQPTRIPDYARDQRRIVSDANALHPLSPSLNPPSSPDGLHPPDTSDDNISSDSRIPLLTPSVASSTPYSHKYIRANAGEHFQTPSTDSATDRSFGTPSTVPNSSASASMELYLGPQPMSFVHHRRFQAAEEFDRSPSRPSPAELDAKAHNGLMIMANVIDDSKEKSHLSTWRQKQLKKHKAARPVQGARERPIPLLHGPLSLPYARNPSGVDATVADQSSYMTHVFGLRAANSPETKASKTGTAPRGGARIPSDSTHRTVSSSSYVSTEGQSDYPSSLSSFGSIKHPLIVRDYSQVIGIKKDANQDPNKVTDLLLPPADHQHQHRSQSDLRANLGLGKPLSPIPGSPSASASFPMALDHAIHSTSAVPWPRQDSNPELLIQDDFVSLALVDPVSNTVYNVRVPKASGASVLGTIPCEIVPTVAKFNSSQHAGSKADASHNWRSNRGSSHATTHHLTPGHLAAPPPSLAGSPYHTVDTGKPVDVITVEQLSQKFGHMRVDSNSKSTTPVVTKKIDKAPVSKMEPAPVKQLGESRQVNVQVDPNAAKPAGKKKIRIATNKTRTSTPTALRSKGTPNAGKHLKPAGGEENEPPIKTKVAASK